MMRRTMIVGMLALSFLLTASPALAHSTKGRVKVDLSDEIPTMDAFAYFIESHVNRERFADTGEPFRDRYIVDRFSSMEQYGSSATVRFVVLDKNGDRRFEDSMTFQRSPGGTWEYLAPDGRRVKVYTYISKSTYHYRTFIKPLGWLIPGVAAFIIGSAAMKRIRSWYRRRAAPQPAPEA